MSRILRAGALTATGVLLAGVAACGPGNGDAAGPGGARERGAASLPAPGSGAELPPLPTALTGQKPRWSACEAPAADGPTARPPGGAWECATVRVPLDYREPDGDTLGIALIRTPATGEGRKRGSLLFNFGGPGNSGVASLPGWGTTFRDLGASYDLVSFDPRGVGGSSAVVCRTSAETEAAAGVDHTPDDPAEEKAYLDDAEDFAAGCERRSGRVLPHVGTENAARDMDVLRAVLGDDRLNYLGFSYGTRLGGVYAHLFPERVGRVVLDAVSDPSADDIRHARHQATGFQRALENYLADCARRDAACPVGGDPEAGLRKVTDLLDRLDREPLPTADGRDLTESQARTGIVRALYSETLWEQLTRALREALSDGRGDRLLALADAYNDRDAEGRYSAQSHAQRAISCADSAERRGAAEARKLLPDFREVSPVFGEFLAWDVAGWCAGWPVRTDSTRVDVSAEGAGPILVIGTTGDPATPFEGSRTMARELGEGVGIHLTHRGEGHGAYNSGNACVKRTVDAYFLAGTVPEDGTTCS
ncbi:alpha/beta fold hydrolase [Streptomyces zingiberis]|uniref:Alpha/beta hydrolase n=1 Tax=Streptomyces zingiberis TaxID=2053010 RepID=A0ABX1BYK9_9ACTN|nr:alpha/beta fold hydrolase [Streptomyces zingiberis]NJQ00955.1 alpha/beta hydrolase [Streptomyces zingiberis]